MRPQTSQDQKRSKRWIAYVLVFLLIAVFAAILLIKLAAWTGSYLYYLDASKTVDAVKDISYQSASGDELKMHLFFPKTDGPHPVIIGIHGGGWTAGSKDDLSYLAVELAKNGYAVAAVSYRFSDIAPYPAQIEDIDAAVSWAVENADAYKLDAGRIGVIGGSAGAHLASLMGVSGGRVPLEYIGPENAARIKAVIDISGPTDLTEILVQCQASAYCSKNIDVMTYLVSGLLSCMPEDCPDMAISASPLYHADPDDAAFLIIHGDMDELVPLQQAENMHSALTAAGVDSRLVIQRGKGHEVDYDIEQMVSFFDEKLS